MTTSVATRPAKAHLAYRFGPPAVAILVVIAAWWLLTTTAHGSHSLLRQTAPQHVIPALAGLLDRGVLLPDAAVSLWRLLIGLCVAALIGIPVGLLIGTSSFAERASRPVVQFLRMISPLSWTPIALALFGIGSQPVIFLIAAAAVWPILMNTVAGVHAIDPGYLDVARSFHATRTETLLAVVLPAIRGHIQTGLRVALGVAWVVLVPAKCSVSVLDWATRCSMPATSWPTIRWWRLSSSSDFSGSHWISAPAGC